MIDNFLSGWGRAKNKINMYVLECESFKEAVIVCQNARNRSEMRCITKHKSKPYYDERKYYVNYKIKDKEYPSRMYQEFGFTKYN